MRAYVQYNAIMLVRILADNPGATFTRNIDSKFVSTVKELLRDGRDMSVQQILRETLDTFELQKSEDETVAPLIAMWKSEKAKWAKKSGNDISSGLVSNDCPLPGASNSFTTKLQSQQASGGYGAPPFAPGQQAYFPPHQPVRHRGGLPPPHELASRIEEARTSGKLLLQVVQSTPPQDILRNELVREFAERCQSASRSIQGYINADNPAPDEETLLTLIDTNDQLSAALSKHQRALLQARKISTQTPPNLPARGGPSPDPLARVSSPENPPANQSQAEPPSVPPAGPPPRLAAPKPPARLENPFDDVHATRPSGEGNGPSLDGQNDAKPGGFATFGARSQPNNEDDEEDSPEQPQRYRF